MMLKRLFSLGKQSPLPPPTLPTALTRPTWHNPHKRFQDYFNLHLHNLDLEQAIKDLTDSYLTPSPSSPVMIVQEQGEWINVYCLPAFVATIGFNRLASDIAARRNIWLIGYRVYESEGIDVHYFQGAEHVAGLAMGQGELEREPVSAQIFADFPNASAVVPRLEPQHPLDFHFALLETLGIANADLTWQDALQKYEMGELPNACLLPSSEREK